VRDAVYHDLSVPERELLHEHAAKALVDHGAAPELIAAQLLAARPESVRTVGTMMKPLLLVVGAACALLMKQPDMGTTMVICFAIGALLARLAANQREEVANGALPHIGEVKSGSSEHRDTPVEELHDDHAGRSRLQVVRPDRRGRERGNDGPAGLGALLRFAKGFEL
jgi:hypothetical protein